MRDKLDGNEVQIVLDLNFCIKTISSNRLYEADLNIDVNDKGDSNNERRRSLVHKDVLSWYTTFSHVNNADGGHRRRSSNSSQQGIIKSSIFEDNAAEQPIDNLLHLSSETQAMM